MDVAHVPYRQFNNSKSRLSRYLAKKTKKRDHIQKRAKEVTIETICFKKDDIEDLIINIKLFLFSLNDIKIGTVSS